MVYNKITETMILIKKSTRQKIKELKITRRESYDELLNRLLPFKRQIVVKKKQPKVEVNKVVEVREEVKKM